VKRNTVTAALKESYLAAVMLKWWWWFERLSWLVRNNSKPKSL